MNENFSTPLQQVQVEAKTTFQIGCDDCDEKCTLEIGGLAGMAALEAVTNSEIPFRIRELVELEVDGIEQEGKISADRYRTSSKCISDQCSFGVKEVESRAIEILKVSAGTGISITKKL